MFHISVVAEAQKIKHGEDIYQTQTYQDKGFFFLIKLKSGFFPSVVKRMDSMKLYASDSSI